MKKKVKSKNYTGIRKLNCSYSTTWTEPNSGSYISVSRTIDTNHCPTCGIKLKKLKP